MKPRTLCTLTLAGFLTSSCIYYTSPVPEMPYTSRTPKTALAQQTDAALAQTEGTWFTSPPQSTAPGATIPDPIVSAPAPRAATPAPAPAPSPAPAATPQPAPQPAPAAAKTPTAITQQPLNLATPTTPKPAAETPRPADAGKPAVASSNRATAQSLKDITNDGPIPVATPVPGKPTHVYNPLEPDLTIRITDKNGNIYPSGKLLKVRGTNFYFYVP